MHGSLSQKKCADPGAFERATYARHHDSPHRQAAQMKLVDEYRDSKSAQQLASVRGIVRKPRTPEVCGGQTHSIVKFGLDTPAGKSLAHGPDVGLRHPLEIIDKAIAIAGRTLCSFGDAARARFAERPVQ